MPTKYGYAEAERIIAQRFAAAWGSRTLVEWPNDPLDDPAGNAWVRYAIEWAEGQRINIGRPRLTRIPGMVTVQVFMPPNSGDGDGSDHGDFAADIFGDENLTTPSGLIRFQTPSIVRVGDGGGGAWWQLNVQCPFTRDAKA